MHVLRWQLRVTLVLALVAASMPVSPALAIGTLDQEQPTIDALAVGGLAIGGGSQQKLGQTFTAGLTGTLTEVALPVACDAGATLTLEIRNVAGGAPGATVLASTSVPAASLPHWVFPAPPSFRTISFPSGAAVTAGIAYALVLTAGNPGCGIFQGPIGDPYAAGDLYFDALPNPPGWVCQCVFANARRDLPFRTYVAVTPTTADLALTLVDLNDPVFASFTSFAYVATVTNNGPAAATANVVTFTLSADLVVAGAAGCTVALPTVTCPMSDLANGATGQVGINVKMANGTSATSVRVDAVVSSALADPVAANNAGSETTTVKAVVDMELLSLSAVPSPANVADQIVYTVTVKNKASTYSYPATSAVALMNIPNGPPDATFVSVTSPVAGALCGFDPPSNRYGCNFGTLASNATATMTLTFTAPTIATTLGSMAQIFAAEPELQPSDNTRTIQVQVVGEQTTFFGQGGTTDVENCTPTGCDGATAADPIETTVNLPAGAIGTITLKEVPTTGTPPSGYTLLGYQVIITAPAGTATMPLTVTFEIHPSLIPAGQNVNTIQVFRNGVLVPPCTNPAIQQAAPDPCVWQRQTFNGNALISVLTSSASVWSFGIHESFAFSGFFDAKTRATAGSTVQLRFSLGGDQGLGVIASAFSVACSGGAVEIAQSGSIRLHYDAETGSYRLQWKTDRDWAGTCRTLKVQLIDGSLHGTAIDFR